jgi:hypothetical protein
MKIGIIDDGVDAAHKFFNPAGFSYPSGFPKGQIKYATPKVIVQRAFPPPGLAWKNGNLPFDPVYSDHATHVAGIAAGDHGTIARGTSISGVAPKAYIGNYKVLTTPTPGFGLDGNSAEIVAGIEAAVDDGMNVINLSLGEPEIDPSRDIVVHAIDAAAAAGVVPVIAAGNDFNAPVSAQYGSIDSPANSPRAISVAATTVGGTIADFSSGGPTPVSLRIDPDLSAPGVQILSSVPAPGGKGSSWAIYDGTSMASPHVAGSALLLKELHPSWTVAQIKSALVQTAQPVHGPGGGGEVSALREGGGLVDLPAANDPLIFASPTSLTFPVNGGTLAVRLTDAGGGAGPWTVTTMLQGDPKGITITADPTVSVPGSVKISATVAPSAASGDVTGFVVLSNGTESRRIAFWVEVSRPKLGMEPHIWLRHPGTYQGTTLGKMSLVTRYRYPTRGDIAYPGPEAVYRVRITRPVANFGVAVTSGTAFPHVVYAGDEDHLVGYDGLPRYLNPYFTMWGQQRQIAGAVLPKPGLYDIVFDTRRASKAGPFTFRFWVNDTTRPTVRLVSSAGSQIVISLADSGAGIDPQSLLVVVDGRQLPDPHYADGRLVIHAAPGKHKVLVQVSDYQEAKNTEDVAAVAPNTAYVQGTITVTP